MVLLTPSAVSAAISGGIICIFTFLLFLSGYVLQQQTVRSLQDAIRNPPDRIAIPTPTLPPQFQSDQGDSVQVRLGGAEQLVLSNNALRDAQTSGRLNDGYESSSTLTSDMIISRESLAYIFAVPNTEELCSVVSFVRKHGQTTRLVVPAQMVLMYPASWDFSDESPHLAAMDLLRELQDGLNVVLHPVTISRVWASAGIKQQLLGELQHTRWPYDRAMYLASPGVVIDAMRLDESLALSNPKGEWTLLHPHPKSHEASHPPVLLWAAGRGLMYPRQDMRSLTARIDQQTDELDMEATIGQAAYIVVNEKEMGGHSSLYEEVSDRMHKERREACAGTGLVAAEV